MISINSSRCTEIGQTISGIEVKRSFLNRKFLTLENYPEQKLRAFFHAVAICHHTYHLAFNQNRLYGWDVIEKVYVSLHETNSELLQLKTFVNLHNNNIRSLLEEAFKENVKSACTLDRLEERTHLLVNLEHWIRARYQGSYRILMKEIGNSITSFYEIIREPEAFSDPLRKKSSFLIKLLIDSGQFCPEDMNGFVPIMDYHMQRVLLRTGCIEVANDLKEQLLKRLPMQSDELIRSACIEAMTLVARASGHSLHAMNDFFWPHGRSCCNEKPVCQHKECEKQPCSLSDLLEVPAIHACIFEFVCPGRDQKNYRLLWQPVIRTHYY
jgi:hypothetical protein